MCVQGDLDPTQVHTLQNVEEYIITCTLHQSEKNIILCYKLLGSGAYHYKVIVVTTYGINPCHYANV
jgi:hypothetical protein